MPRFRVSPAKVLEAVGMLIFIAGIATIITGLEIRGAILGIVGLLLGCFSLADN